MASTFIKLPKVSGGGGGGAVDSFNGRTGVVVSQLGDYSAGIVSNTPAGDISATDVQAAINELDTEKQATITGAASSVTTTNLNPSVVVITDGSGKIDDSTITATELLSLSGVSSNIQTQIDGKQPLDSDLTAIAALASSGFIVRAGAGTAQVRNISTDSSIDIINANGVSGSPTLSLPVTGVTPGTYTLSEVTVNDRGIISAISSGTPTEVSPNDVIMLFDDFTGSSVSLGSYGFTATTSGTGASVTTSTLFQNVIDKAIGIVDVQTGTSASSRSSFTSSTSAFVCGYSILEYNCRATVSSIGDASNQYEYTFGFIDNTSTPSHHTDGIYFRFLANGVNTFWECVTSQASIRTITTTSATVNANDFELFKISVNQDGTIANFYINGILVASHNTNIPISPNFFGFGGKAAKIVAVSGSEGNLFVDWISVKVTFPGGR